MFVVVLPHGSDLLVVEVVAVVDEVEGGVLTGSVSGSDEIVATALAESYGRVSESRHGVEPHIVGRGADVFENLFVEDLVRQTASGIKYVTKTFEEEVVGGVIRCLLLDIRPLEDALGDTFGVARHLHNHIRHDGMRISAVSKQGMPRPSHTSHR